MLILSLLMTSVAAVWIIGCVRDKHARAYDAVSLALDWNHFMLTAEVSTEGYRGPVAARAYGYVGVAAYEAARPGFEGDFKSLKSLYPEIAFPSAPQAEHYNMGVALNECYATILNRFFITSPGSSTDRRAELEEKWVKKMQAGLDSVTIKASRTYGHLVGEAVYAWSATDSMGYAANHHNYDRNYIPPIGDGLWVISPDFPMPPLLPYWGKVRPFVIKTDQYIAKPLPPYSTETNQLYQVQALELVSLSKPLSAESQWIAEFWNDDRPGLTFSPAGHWLSITNQVIEKEHPTIEKTLETYLKVGIALADAMIACFNAKYIYNLERPETYIRNNIDSTWHPFLPAPSFPSYPSGHSMMGAAAAEVLTQQFGEAYALKDRSHDWLENFSVKPRSFTSFDEMARENALSRVLLGVHWRFDCEEGLRLGSLVGKEVREIQVENKLTE